MFRVGDLTRIFSTKRAEYGWQIDNPSNIESKICEVQKSPLADRKSTRSVEGFDENGITKFDQICRRLLLPINEF